MIIEWAEQRYFGISYWITNPGFALPSGHTGHGRKTRRSVIEDLRYSIYKPSPKRYSKLKSKR